jgi:hypothetical protein
VFRCSLCKESIGQRIKPTRVVTMTRAVEYHNEYEVEDEWGNKQLKQVDSQGHEIVSEAILCPEDAEKNGIIAPTQARVRSSAHSFDETLAPPMHSKFVAFAVHSTLERLGHESKRAKRDCAVAVPGIKQFVDLNKDLKF